MVAKSFVLAWRPSATPLFRPKQANCASNLDKHIAVPATWRTSCKVARRSYTLRFNSLSNFCNPITIMLQLQLNFFSRLTSSHHQSHNPIQYQLHVLPLLFFSGGHLPASPDSARPRRPLPGPPDRIISSGTPDRIISSGGHLPASPDSVWPEGIQGFATEMLAR